MIIKIYSVKDIDSQENAFACPFYAENDVLAKRQFDMSMKQVPDEIKGQFSLFRVGTFDTVTGTILSHVPAEVWSKEVQEVVDSENI